MLKKIKSFLILPILLISLFSISLFSACGKKDDGDQTPKNPSFNVAANIKSAADGVVSTLFSRVYNNEAWKTNPKTYTVEEAETAFSELNYYIEIGNLTNVSDVTSIGMGNLTINKDQEFSLSVGNNNFIKGKIYKFANNKLYVAAPIIAFESVNNSKIKINGVEYTLDLDTDATIGTFSNVKWQNGSSNTVTEVANSNKKEYDLEVTNSTTWLELYYTNSSPNDLILTRKINNSSDLNYGLTKSENIEGNPLAFYVVGWNKDLTTDANKEIYDDMEIKYSAYILGKGIKEAVLNLSIPE